MKKTDKVTVTFEDGNVMDFEAGQLRKFLNENLRKPRTKVATQSHTARYSHLYVVLMVTHYFLVSMVKFMEIKRLNLEIR